jgi:iron complex transport system ATP-binding protein
MTAGPAHHAPVLAARDLQVGYHADLVLDGLDLTVPQQAVTVIVGANACGKSTLLKALSRALRPRRGVVSLDGEDLSGMPARRLARSLGMLPQQPVAPEGLSVADLVGRGRHPHQGAWHRWTTHDDAVVAEALTVTATADLADRDVAELSGGQRQRVWIAMALAQDPDVLLLDEPTTFLDLTHQLEVLDLLVELNRSRGTTIVMVLHDLNLAARYGDHLIVMAGGAVLAQGPPAEVITPAVLQAAFRLDALVVADPVTGGPMIVPRHRAPGRRRGDRPSSSGKVSLT